MIFNIHDKRLNKFKWQRITAIIEPVWHDNYCGSKQSGDQYKPTEQEEEAAGIGYKEIPLTSIAIAVEIANELPYPVTLFIYDEGKGIDIVRYPRPAQRKAALCRET